jgi:hypothetical protein
LFLRQQTHQVEVVSLGAGDNVVDDGAAHRVSGLAVEARHEAVVDVAIIIFWDFD